MVTKIIKFWVLLLPFAAYSISVGLVNISLDRVLGIIMIISFLYYLLFIGKIRNDLFIILYILNILYLLFNRLLLGPHLHNLFPMALYNLVMSFIVYYWICSNFKNIRHTINVFLPLFIIHITFTFYTLYQWISNNNYALTLPFSHNLHFLSKTEMFHLTVLSEGISIIPRVSLPYGTPPWLSIIMACFTIIFIYMIINYKPQNNKKPPKVLYLSLILSLITTLLTMSRSGLLSLLIGGIYFISSLGILKKSYIVKSVFWIIIIVLIGTLYLTNHTVIAKVFSDRFLDFTQQSSQGHLDARYSGYHAFMGASLINKLFGIGVGNIPGLHYHMTYLSVLVEKGIVGFILHFGIYFIALKKLIFIKDTKINFGDIILKKFAISILITLLVGHLLYEFNYLPLIWVFLGVVLGISKLLHSKDRVIQIA